MTQVTRKPKPPWNAGTRRERLHHKRKAAIRTLVRRVEDTLDRKVMLDAFSQLHDDDRFVALVADMCDPQNANVTLLTHLKRHHISYAELVDAFKRTKMDEGLLRFYQHVPQVLDDTGEDAKSHHIPCTRCDGEGIIKTGKRERKCASCRGTGSVRERGDKDARNTVFESIGLTGKRGPLVAQQFNIGDGSESLEQCVGDVRALLEAPAPAKVSP